MFKMIFSLLFASICWFTGLASAAPVADTEPRAATTTTVVSWATQTVTVNPSDSTIWGILATVTEWPFTTTSTIKSGCVTVTNVFPQDDSTPTSSDSTTSTVTSTITSRSTVTETGTEHPPTTRYTLSVVSMSTGRTESSIECTNTAVRSLYVTTTYTSTRILAGSRTTVRNTEVCMTSTTRWLPTPSATFVTSSPTPWRDPGYYTNGTIVTVSEGIPRTTWITVSTDVLVATSVICNNPTTRTTSTYYTLTRSPFTTTIYNQPTGCSSSPVSAATPTATAVPSPTLPRWENAAVQDVQHAPENVRKQADSPVESRTVFYTTTGMLTNGTVATLTWTGIVETYTQTFTTISMVGATVTATATRHLSGCSVPTTAASSG